MKDKLRKFYKMRLSCNECGLSVFTERFFLVHETECFFFVIPEWKAVYLHEPLKESETLYDLAKRKCGKIKRFRKDSGRFAFDTKKEAFNHLKFLKGKQFSHLKRDLEVVTAFLSNVEGKKLSELPKDKYYEIAIPNTKEVVDENFIFD